MTLERSTDFLTGAKSWTITIYPAEFNAAEFNPGDQLLLDDCASEDATIADTLLGLELITRRIEETELRHAA